MDISTFWSRVIAIDPLTLFLYVCLALVAWAFFALNIRVGPSIQGRASSIPEVLGGRRTSRIWIWKLSLAAVWIILFLFALYRLGFRVTLE